MHECGGCIILSAGRASGQRTRTLSFLREYIAQVSLWNWTHCSGVASHGASWEKIGRLVGRTGYDCKDRYRNHLSCREGHAVGKPITLLFIQHEFSKVLFEGKWSAEEEARLVQVVGEVLIDHQGKTSHPDIWAQVQHRLGNSRTRQQCRDKWYVSGTSILSKY